MLAAQFITEHPDLFDQSYETFIVDNKHYAYDKGDVLFGGEGNDLIYGQGGNDILFGDGTFGTPDADGHLNDYGTLQKLADLLGKDDSTAENNVEELVGKLNANGEYNKDSQDSVTSNLNMDGLKNLAENLENKEQGIESETDGNDLLFGSSGNDLLLGGGGNDYLDGGEGKDSIFGGSGNDLIVYDSNDFAVFGGSGIDILLSNTADNNTTLKSLLDDNGGQPHVNGVEVFLKSTGNTFNVEDLTSLSDLAEKAGITVDGDTLTFTGKGWEVDEGNHTAHNDGLGLTVELSDSMIQDTINQNVFLLQTTGEA